MPRKKEKDASLKDEGRSVLESELSSLKGKLSAIYEAEANRILKKKNKELSNSVPAISGGRPESNRRKF